jgi:glucosylceramidase
MQAEGINIDAITIQNEPLFGGNNPSMVMHAEQQAEFIKQSLGPAFEKYSIKTKILIYDHNPDRPDYPLEILLDEQARQYVDGSAFHMYAGRVEALSLVHDAHPDKNIYFTEYWTGAHGTLKADLVYHIKTLIIGGTRNWARNVLEWNLAADSKWKPHTPGGCSNCLGALTIDGDKVLSPRNPSYYIIAHAAKFIRPNSVRIGTNVVLNLPNVAFQRSDDRRQVLVVLNEHDRNPMTFFIRCNDYVFETSLNASSVGTYIY